MRITGGKNRGLTIKTPMGGRTRPTSDKVREALFSVLGDQTEGARVLDLFAGSGALAIEAMSRGAERAVVVEKSSTVVSTIRLNLDTAGFAGATRIIRADFRSAIARLKKDGESFDLVFVDPPYESGLLDKAAAELGDSGIVADDGVIVLEHFKKTEPPDSVCGIPLDKRRDYGQTSLSFYRRR